MTTVLVTDAGYKHTLAAVRSLASAGCVVDAIGEDRSLCRYSRYLRRIAYPQRDFREECFDRFVRFLEAEPYDVLVPIGARSVRLLAKHRQAIERYAALPLAGADHIEFCMNKHRLNALAAELGLHVPRSWAADGEDAAEGIAGEARFPLVVKGGHELDRVGACRVEDPVSLKLALSRRRPAVEGDGTPWLVQEWIEGRGCGFFALYDRGRLHRLFMHQRVRMVPPSGGQSCCAESIYAEDLLQAGRLLLDALEWHGVAMVEFIRDAATGRLYLLEVNPKFWGSLDLAIAAGVDFPGDLVKLALGRPIASSAPYRVGLRFHWPLGEGDLVHFCRSPRSGLSILRDCLSLRVRSNLRLGDPGPALRSLWDDLRVLRGR